jgi:hypothetical protein
VPDRVEEIETGKSVSQWFDGLATVAAQNRFLRANGVRVLCGPGGAWLVEASWRVVTAPDFGHAKRATRLSVTL